MRFGIAITLILALTSSAIAGELFTQLDELYASKSDAKIESRCQIRLRHSKKSMECLYFLSAIRLRSGDDAGAAQYIEAFKKNTGRSNDLYSGLYLHIGQTYTKAHEFDLALKWLERAKTGQDASPMLHFCFGVVYQNKEKFAEAIKSFKRESELDPKEPSPFYNIACAYAQQGNEKEALEWLSKGIALHPDFKKDARDDKDFDKIRNSSKFKELIGE